MKVIVVDLRHPMDVDTVPQYNCVNTSIRKRIEKALLTTDSRDNNRTFHGVLVLKINVLSKGLEALCARFGSSASRRLASRFLPENRYHERKIPFARILERDRNGDPETSEAAAAEVASQFFCRIDIKSERIPLARGSSGSESHRRDLETLSPRGNSKIGKSDREDFSPGLGRDRPHRRHRQPQFVPELVTAATERGAAVAAVSAAAATAVLPGQDLQPVEGDAVGVAAITPRSLRDRRRRARQSLQRNDDRPGRQRGQLLQDRADARVRPDVVQGSGAEHDDDSPGRVGVRTDLQAPCEIPLRGLFAVRLQSQLGRRRAEFIHFPRGTLEILSAAGGADGWISRAIK
ncbi:hypothetical protein DBV15_08833 [Temnothorax longispinosus]|uniref:Uncharacterized protein n=1 Tax=Temnothorax longispinosus TaxID=300112 RepID=A0A4S2JBW5_9HYME|nr:hypothetical protein DBV15_08833 [Temnothorax longispinosus]